MLTKIIDFSLRNKLIIILLTLTIAGFGIYSILRIPVGAVPDITNNQVQVITTSGNLSTQEIEQFITAPVELEMANLPGVEEIRSVSKFGLSVVTIVFNDKIGTYLPRQLIAEKIKSASSNIPEGFGTPEMGPITTGLGEIYQYILDLKPGYEDMYSPMELRSIQDWIVKRQLSGIDGVVEVNTWGGFLKQYEVAIDPDRMRAIGITLKEVFDALEANNSITGGAYIEKTSQSYFIRGDGLVKSLEDIEKIIVKSNNGIPVLIKDVAQVQYGYANRFGAITANGEGEKVLGQIMMLKDANSKLVINEVKARVAEIQENLPEGVFINPILERSELISKTSFTVVENLILGCIIVVLIVILLLGNVRSALVIASMIPLALLFTLSMMYIFGVDANLMSLGALDFGIIIDGAVIIVEFIAVRITAVKKDFESSGEEEKQNLIDKITYNGASKMMNSAVFGQIIILIVFIPILSLSGVEGKMFRPMAMTFSFAIIGAMILGLTWLPVAASLFLKPQKVQKNNISDWLMRQVYRSYMPVMKWSCEHKKIVFTTALVSLMLTLFLFSRMGGEFVPTLDEGDFVIQPVFKTGTSLTKTIEMTTQMEKVLINSFPEVDQIVSRIGAAEVPTDPMSMEEIDMIIKLKPREEWVSAADKEELAEKFEEALSVMPGIDFEFTQPIEMRFNELITGVRADIAVKIFGDDLEYLNTKATEIKELIEKIPGAADVILEKTAGLPQMSVVYKRDKIALYNTDINTLNSYLSMAFGGSTSGSVFEGERRFDLVLRFQEQSRTDIENIMELQVPLAGGIQIPLRELADITITEGPAKISRDNTQRRVVVSVNVRNRDLQSVVEDIQDEIKANISLKPGNYIAYGGQFENLMNATNRLKLAVPVALLLIFIFLHFAFKSFKDALMIFTAIPLATVGGVLLLSVRGMPFSVSAGIGFIALFGIAVLNGIVLIEHLKDLQKKGMKDMRELILKGTKDRLRPVLLTAAAAAMGFLPMAISTGSGAEVQRPLATVVIGGLISSTMLTMIALPLLFEIFYNVTSIKLWPFRVIRAKNITIIILLLFIVRPAASQIQELTADEAVEVAIRNNEELKTSFLKVKESTVLVPASFSAEKTILTYGYDKNNIAPNGFPLKVFGIEQSINFPTVYLSQLKAARINRSVAETDYLLQKKVLTGLVMQNYYEILSILNKQILYRSLDSLYNELIKGNELRYSEGDISSLDLLNAKAGQRKISSELNGLRYELEISYQKFKALLQYDSTFAIPYQELVLIPVNEPEIESGIGSQLMLMRTEYQNSLNRVEINKLLPDLSVNYFTGTNSFPGAAHYNGFQIGVALPVFFGSQKAKIQAGKVASEINESQRLNYINKVHSRYGELKSELGKHMEAIDYYNTSGRKLTEEILRTSERSYKLGEIDFFRFASSVENAIELKLKYIEDVSMYNQVAIKINYLTD